MVSVLAASRPGVRVWSFFAAAALLGCGTPVASDGVFATEVHPIMVGACSCHDNPVGPGSGSSQLGPGDFGANNLSISYDSALQYLVPGNPNASSLYLKVLPNDEGQPAMPPSATEPIPESEQIALRDWIAEGASPD